MSIGFAVALEPEEQAQFPAAVPVELPELGLTGTTYVIPYKDGRCIHLTADNKCGIYNRRPLLCREFNCLHGYLSKGQEHGYFLEDKPDVVELIASTHPEFVATREQERDARVRAWRLDQ